MWFRALLLVFALSGVAGAQSFKLPNLSFGAQGGLMLNFGLPSSPLVIATAEARGLVAGFGVRASLGFTGRLEAALDGLYRFDGLNQGLLYLGGGLGYSGDLEFRAVIGYEWDLGSRLRLGLEGQARFPTTPGLEPRLGLMLCLVWLLPGAAPGSP